MIIALSRAVTAIGNYSCILSNTDFLIVHCSLEVTHINYAIAHEDMRNNANEY